MHVAEYERRSRSPEAIATVIEMVRRNHENRQAVLRASIGKHADAIDISHQSQTKVTVN